MRLPKSPRFYCYISFRSTEHHSIPLYTRRRTHCGNCSTMHATNNNINTNVQRPTSHKMYTFVDWSFRHFMYIRSSLSRIVWNCVPFFMFVILRSRSSMSSSFSALTSTQIDIFPMINSIYIRSCRVFIAYVSSLSPSSSVWLCQNCRSGH